MAAMATPDLIEEVDLEQMFQADTPWCIIVSNDPVNLIDMVVTIFQRVLELEPEKAMEYTMRVHKEGSCTVYWGSEEECTTKAEQLMAHNLWARVEKAGN